MMERLHMSAISLQGGGVMVHGNARFCMEILSYSEVCLLHCNRLGWVCSLVLG